MTAPKLPEPMSDERLAEIRAAVYRHGPEFWPYAHDLLAEVDRLRAELDEARDAAESWRERACEAEPDSSDWVAPGMCPLPWEVAS